MLLDRWLRLSLFPLTLFIALINTGNHSADVGLPCIVKLLFDIDCPGCGISRSIVEIWRGNINLSYSYNKFGLIVFSLIAFMFAKELFVIFFKNTRSDING